MVCLCRCGVYINCAYLQMEMCKRNHKACYGQEPRNRQVGLMMCGDFNMCFCRVIVVLLVDVMPIVVLGAMRLVWWIEWA